MQSYRHHGDPALHTHSQHQSLSASCLFQKYVCHRKVILVISELTRKFASSLVLLILQVTTHDQTHTHTHTHTQPLFVSENQYFLGSQTFILLSVTLDRIHRDK